jgi:hypothetical protein
MSDPFSHHKVRAYKLSEIASALLDSNKKDISIHDVFVPCDPDVNPIFQCWLGPQSELFPIVSGFDIVDFVQQEQLNERSD